MWYIGGYVFLADPATKAAAGQYTRNGWGYLAMVCVYLYGFIYCMTWQGALLQGTKKQNSLNITFRNHLGVLFRNLPNSNSHALCGFDNCGPMALVFHCLAHYAIYDHKSRIWYVSLQESTGNWH